MEKKIKLYRNSRRSEQESVEKYMPQYQQMGVDPVEYDAPKHTRPIKIATPTEENPRLSKPPVRQEYAPPVKPINFEKGMMPNVGNNMEHSWSSVDDIVDDVGFDSTKIIDNNDYVSPDAFNEVESSFFRPIKEVKVSTSEAEASFIEELYGLDEKDYVLIVNGNLVCSGTLLDVQSQVKDVVFGEHELFTEAVPVENVLVLQRSKIKMGVFIE